MPRALTTVNSSANALFRLVDAPEGRPTILFDEIDTVFGPKAGDNEPVRGFLNSGYRRSGKMHRCVGDGANQTVQPFSSFCAVAMAGLGSLPDTILTRSVIIRMRKRAPNESVESYRQRLNEKEGFALRDRLAEWADSVRDSVKDAWPEMPDGINDRPADVWEPPSPSRTRPAGTGPSGPERRASNSSTPPRTTTKHPWASGCSRIYATPCSVERSDCPPPSSSNASSRWTTPRGPIWTTSR